MKIFKDHITKDFLIKNPPFFRGAAFQPEGSKTWVWEFIISFGDRKVDDPINVITGSPKTKNFINQISAMKNMQMMIPKIITALDEHVGGIPDSEFFKNVNEKEDAGIEFLEGDD